MSKPIHSINRLLIGVLLLVAIGVFGLWMWRGNSNPTQKFEAVSGIIDLRKADIQHTTIPLDGEWQFVWGQLKQPTSASEKNAVLMKLPRVWNGFKYENKSLPAQGIATYQLAIIIGPNQQASDLALYIPFVHSSYALFLDDKLIASDGTVASSAAAFKPASHTLMVPIKGRGDTLSLTLQVANFAYALGGVWQSPRIGARTAIQSHYDRQLAFDLFIFGGLFIMSLYHIALYFLRRRIKSNLYFSLLCFFLAIKNLFSGVAFFYTLWPAASYESGLKLIHISIFAGAVLCWYFLRELFEKEFPLWVGRALLIVTSACIIITLFTHSSIYSQIMLPFWVLIGFIMILMFRGIYLAVKRQREGAFVILVGVLCFLLTVVHDLAIDFNFIQGVYLSGAGFFLFIFSQALLLSLKFTNSFKKVEHLTQDIMNTNRSYSRFVPSEFLSYLNKESINDVELGDHLQGEMTVFFSDIRSYTSLSELMSPKTNFAFINEYLGRVVHFIEHYGGLVNQYLGDGILALFMNSAEDAVKAAIKIQQDISEVTELGGFQLKKTLKNGIGIHSGPLILGMLGTAQRMSTGVISDTVNTASRIEGLTKFFGAQIIISESSLSQIKDSTQFSFRSLGKVRVKGKQDVLRIYEILDGLPEDQKNLKIITNEDFESGLKAYFDKNFQLAMVDFEKVLSINPDDLAAKIYWSNAEKFLKERVSVDWKGELKMEIK
jgi:class 3 adenylate cyclase